MPVLMPVEHDPFAPVTIPVDHDPFDERWNAQYDSDPFSVAAMRTRQSVQPMGGRMEGTTTRLLNTAAPYVTGEMLPRMGGELLDLAKTPGEILSGQTARQPSIPGQWSDEDEAAAQLTNAEAVNRATSIAANTMGMGSPFARPGSVGTSGGKLTQPPASLLIEPEGIRAYHGSPHNFDKFDISKIGTGEGVQSYGHGLYFAGNEATAKSYRDSLAGNSYWLGDRKLGTIGELKDNPEALAAHMLDLGKGKKDALLRLELAEQRYREGDYGVAPSVAKETRAAINRLAGQKIDIRPSGKMYEVNIDAKPEQFLDWDRPLTEQPSPLVDPLVDLSREHNLMDPRERGSMQSVIYDLGHRKVTGSPANASAALRDAGIPGIKYLDQGSRRPLISTGYKNVDIELGRHGGDWEQFKADKLGQSKALDDAIRAIDATGGPTFGPRTSNYVVFDDKIVSILRKYGLAGLSLMPPAIAAEISNRLRPVDHDPFAEQRP